MRFIRSAGTALACLLTFGLLLTAAPAKRKARGAEITCVQVKVQRAEGRVALDGRVKNTGDRTISGALLIFHFQAPGREVITTKQGPLEAEVLEPGEEADFHVHIVDPVRAVRVRIEAQDGSGRDLRVQKSGPFPIE